LQGNRVSREITLRHVERFAGRPGSTGSLRVQRYLDNVSVSAAGLAAERLRMEVIANNIANAQTTRTPEGGPYRRQQVSFAALYDQIRSGGSNDSGKLKGVRVLRVDDDPSEFPRIYQPGHPDAASDGFVAYPNVQVAMEMVDLIAASRAYESNLNALKTFKDMTENTLSLLRSV
jgi:flagellar basal-body rod protein FlgC